jgi:amino acid adenylation domain-containing protein
MAHGPEPQTESLRERIAQLPPNKRAALGRLLRSQAAEGIPRRQGSGPAPLTFAQRRLWFLDQLSPESPWYNVHSATRLKSQLDVEALRRAIRSVVHRHESLRSTFPAANGDPVQLVAAEAKMPLPVTDLRGLDPAAREREMMRLATEEARHPFHLAAGPLLRTALLRVDDADYVFLVTMHHIVADGWSMQILGRELEAFYAAFQKDEQPVLPELPIQYADFACWQQAPPQREAVQAQLGYWNQQLSGVPALRLPADRPRPPEPTFRGGLEYVKLRTELVRSLEELSRREGATLFMTLLAAFQTLLHRYTGQDDIAVGVPTAGRNRPELQGLIGLFINTLVIRTQFSGNPSFRELLRRVRAVCLDAFSHEEAPLDQIVDEVAPGRERGVNPLFQTSFQLFQESAGNADSALVVPKGTANVDLALDLFQSGDQIRGPLEYSTDLFDAATGARLARHFQTLLEAVALDPDTTLSDLPLLDEQECRTILVDWNDTAAPIPAVCAQEFFEAQAARSPEAVALVFQGRSVTFAELNGRANALAARLRALGLRPESVAALSMERSLDLVVALLGIWKAGGACLPIDPDYPADRHAFLMRDCKPALVIADEALAPRFEGRGARVVTPAEFGPTSAAEGPTALPDNLAYVIYTSGSTGTPKGVMVTHRSLVNHLAWWQTAFPMDARDAMPLKYSLSFDVALLEIMAPLAAGARLVIAEPGRQHDGAYLARLIRDERITAVDVVPALLRAIVAEPLFTECRSLRRITCGGDVLTPELASQCAAANPALLYNLYGPTEATIGATWWACRSAEEGTIPIGRPIANTRIYVLDPGRQPVPPGVIGEIHIGGTGVARGYLNQPELTAERFFPDPFGEGMVYRTGDLGRWRANGVLEFTSRADGQVKIRGFRIEPGEVQAALARHPSVRECAVAAHVDESGEQRLVAYVVPVAEPEFWPSVGEYGLHDEFLNQAAARQEQRNRAYGAAIGTVAKGKIVLVAGDAGDNSLERMCREARAREVRVWDGSGEVRLPDRGRPAEVCVSEDLGCIASAEGIVPLLNRARRMLAPDAVIVPERAVTRIAAVRLPDALASDPRFTDVSGPYAEKIFAACGRPFDVRLAIHNLPKDHVLSDSVVFEELDFRGPLALDPERELRLTIERSGRVDGLLLWLDVWTRGEWHIDVLHHPGAWLPIFFPVFYPGVVATAGDSIKLRRTISNSRLPDYTVEGALVRQGSATAAFHYESGVASRAYRANLLYERLFDGRPYQSAAPVAGRGEWKKHLAELLPSYLVPSTFFTLPSLPLLPSGKLDQRALAALARARQTEPSRTPPRAGLERTIALVWEAVLGVENIGATDNFFDLGGHSLLAVKLRSSLRDALARDIPIVDIFRYPTIRSLAGSLREEQK